MTGANAPQRPAADLNRTMLTISKRVIDEELLIRVLGDRVGAATGMSLNGDQCVALTMLASTLGDDAIIADLVRASAIDAAAAAGLMSDTIGHFAPVRLALEKASADQLSRPLFDLREPKLANHKFDRPATHVQTICPECREVLRWKATSWRNIKDRPYACSREHVFVPRYFEFTPH